MKLLRLRADSFGALKGEFRFEPDRVAIVVDQNERGKSTLLAAVSAALYGLDGDKRRWPALTPLDRWRPWEGTGFALELELESAGQRYTIRRDFARGTVEVWDSRGKEVTFEFREGKESFPVGRKLLGIDLEEFEKCAFVRQSDLEQVVPAEEKTRRAGTLQARLESAADTRGGDTNATEALQLLENAVRKYTCPEVEFTGMVENALQRLETKRGVLESEVKSLEHDLERIAEPLGELTRLGEEESGARLALARLDDERKNTLANELRAKLREDDEHRAELAKLEAELKSLGSSDHMGENAEAELSQTVGQLEQAERNLAALETRHREETASARAGLEAEMGRYTTVSTATAGDADRLIALAAEMRRVADEDGRRRTEIGGLREQLAGRGIDPERVRTLTRRFDGLDDDRLSCCAASPSSAWCTRTISASSRPSAPRAPRCCARSTAGAGRCACRAGCWWRWAWAARWRAVRWWRSRRPSGCGPGSSPAARCWCSSVRCCWSPPRACASASARRPCAG